MNEILETQTAQLEQGMASLQQARTRAAADLAAIDAAIAQQQGALAFAEHLGKLVAQGGDVLESMEEADGVVAPDPPVLP